MLNALEAKLAIFSAKTTKLPFIKSLILKVESSGVLVWYAAGRVPPTPKFLL
jgi:hypothetical protein